MTPRSIRRAAQRRADKLARKTGKPVGDTLPVTPFAPEIQFPCDESGLTAKTPTQTTTPAVPPAAAANAHLTAVVSALTGFATLLPAADAEPFAQLLRDYQIERQPVGLQESNLVQTLAETNWRASRTLALEMAIFARGRIEFAPLFAEHNPELRESLIDVHTFLTYEKQIHRLQLQEARLSRRTDKASAELRALQQERAQREEHARRQQQENEQRQLEAAAQLYQDARNNQQTFDPGQNGFVFSNQEIESYLAEKQARKERFAAARNLAAHSQAA